MLRKLRAAIQPTAPVGSGSPPTQQIAVMLGGGLEVGVVGGRWGPARSPARPRARGSGSGRRPRRRKPRGSSGRAGARTPACGRARCRSSPVRVALLVDKGSR
jgi:hypothetical protein